MRIVGILLAGCLALGALQAAAKVLALAFLVILLGSAIARPFQTLGCLTWLLALGLIGRYPLVALPALGVLAAIGAWSNRQ